MYYDDYDDDGRYYEDDLRDVDLQQDVAEDDVRVTWAGPFGSSELYGPQIRALSWQTDSNLERLRSTLSTPDIYRPYQNDFKMNSMFSVGTKSSPFSISSSPSFDDTESVTSNTGFNFCYLCSTLEEHQRNHKYPKKPPKSRKPRIEYIAPKPRPKKKEIEPEVTNHEALYRVVVYVGNVPQSSSDANVSVTIVGTRDILPKTRLCRGKNINSKFCFVRGAVEKFYVKGPKLGDLKILTIEHDGLEKRHSLYLDKIEVTEMLTDQTWIFICKNWLSLHHGDYCIQRDLEATHKERITKEYEIEIMTGKKRLGGTDANVYITLQGTERSSHKIHLNKGQKEDHFNRGQTDKFLISLRDIGVIKSLKVEHDGQGMADGWFLERITIRNTSNTKEVYYFLYGGWIATDEGDGKLWREIKAKRKLDKILERGLKIRYKVRVKTGDRQFAGTDANVYIQFVGPKGSTKQLKLDDSRNNFERGMLEEFDVTGIDVGELGHVIIGHDNSGPGAGWFLEYIEVEKYFTAAQIKEKLAKLRGLSRDESSDKDDTSKYVAMGRRRSSFSRQKAVSQSDEENENDTVSQQRQRRKSKAEIKEIFDRDGNVARIPFYEKYSFKCERWLAANEDDGLFQRELKPYDKTVYYKDKNET